VTGVHIRGRFVAVVLWGLAHLLGQSASEFLGWTVADALPIALAGAVGATLVIRSLLGEPVPGEVRWGWPAHLVAAALGLLAGATMSGTVRPAGLSYAEARMASLMHGAGVFLSAVWMTAIVSLLCSVLLSGEENARRRVRVSVAHVAGILAAGLGIYHLAGVVLSLRPVAADFGASLRPRLAARYVAPFTGDWAMGILRIPLVSLVLAVCALVLLFRRTPLTGRKRRRVLLSGGLLLLAIVLLPWTTVRVRTPLFAGRPPSAAQGQRILEPLLTQIYLALNIADENEAYDRLAEQVSGPLTTDLYLDSRRRLVAGTRGAATVVVRDVAVADVDSPFLRDSEAREFTYPCRWIVTARVTHWQHSHDRRNVYEGDLTLTVDDDRWKLAGLELRTEEREVVPGSFASR
jgi:hypothetical protein